MYKNSDNTSLDLKFKYCEKATKLLKNLFFNININDIVMSKLSERFSKSLGPSQNILIFQWPTLSDFLSCDRFSILSQFFFIYSLSWFFLLFYFQCFGFPRHFFSFSNNLLSISSYCCKILRLIYLVDVSI